MATLGKPGIYPKWLLLAKSSKVATFKFPIGKPEVAKFGKFRKAIVWLRFESFLSLLLLDWKPDCYWIQPGLLEVAKVGN